MSHVELQIIAEKDDIFVKVEKPPPVNLAAVSTPDVKVILAGNVGPPGPQGKWMALTQSEYDAIDPKDPDTLYVIIQ